MKATTKRKILTGIFLFITAVLLAWFVYTIVWTGWSTTQGDHKFVVKEEVLEMTVGDTLPFEEIHPDYQSNLEKDNGYRFSYQTARRLGDGKNLVKGPYSQYAVFVDEQGMVHATATGVYQLEYAVVDIRSEQDGLFTQSDTRTVIFTATIAVYADEYDPFPTDPMNFKLDGNYKLTSDITLDAFRWCKNTGSFKGVIINPDGYTITLRTDYSSLTPNAKAIPISFLDWNDGILDGVKICYESTESAPFITEVYAFCESNNGYIKNCSATGDVYIDGQETGVYGPIESTRAFFVGLTTNNLAQGNDISVNVYNDGPIYPYTLPKSLVQDELPSHVQGLKNNRVAINTYYYTNLVNANERDIVMTGLGGEEYTYADKNGNTFVPAYPHLGNKPVRTCILHIRATRDTVYGLTMRVGGPIEISPECWKEIMGLEYSNSDPEIVFRNWIVDGESLQSLNGKTATKDMEISAVSEYGETILGNIDKTTIGTTDYYRLMNFYNASDEMTLSVSNAEDGSTVSLYNGLFQRFFENPYNRIPKKIIFPANTKFVWDFSHSSEDPFDTNSVKALHKYLLGGGELEVEAGNTELSFLEDKAICSADGKLLYYYFPEENESSVSIPAPVEKVWWNAFVAGGEKYKTLDLSTVEEVDVRIFERTPALESVRFGEKISVTESVKPDVSYLRTIKELLSKAPTLQSVAIHQDNKDYKAENGFVSEKKYYTVNGKTTKETALVYVLPSMKGSITVPHGITALEDNAFMACNAEEIIFPDSLRLFKSSALSGMNELTSIRFGASPEIREFWSARATLPKLTSVSFAEGTKDLYFEYDAFKYSNLGTVVLPSTLQTCKGMFTACEKFVYTGVGTGIRVDEAGALYREDTLIAFPAHSKLTEYEVTGAKVFSYAFYKNTALKKVVFGVDGWMVTGCAFEGTEVEEVVFKTASAVYIYGHAFRNCAGLKQVVFEKTTAKILLSESAFENCEKLESFPVEQVISLGGSAFKNTALTSVSFHEDMLQIPDSAFENCEKLISVTFAKTQTIGKNAFKGCTALESVSGEYITQVETGAFMDSGVKTVNFPALQSIGVSVFENCGRLAEVTFAEKITVDEQAFKGCVSLQGLGESALLSVGESAFENCGSLTAVTFGEVTKTVFSIRIAKNAFAQCGALKSVFIFAGDGTVTIEEGAFKNCYSLISVFISAEKGSIATGAFAGVVAQMELMIDGGEEWQISGSLPKNITVFVREDLVETFREKWIVDDKQILAIPKWQGDNE